MILYLIGSGAGAAICMEMMSSGLLLEKCLRRLEVQRLFVKGLLGEGKKGEGGRPNLERQLLYPAPFLGHSPYKKEPPVTPVSAPGAGHSQLSSGQQPGETSCASGSRRADGSGQTCPHCVALPTSWAGQCLCGFQSCVSSCLLREIGPRTLSLTCDSPAASSTHAPHGGVVSKLSLRQARNQHRPVFPAQCSF